MTVTEVQTNFFSKGCTDTYDRGGFSPVADPINQFHTYTLQSLSDKMVRGYFYMPHRWVLRSADAAEAGATMLRIVK